jgi:hypothetical protein
VAEQRGDREPVGEPSHHAGLRGGADEPHPAGGAGGLNATGQQVDNRRDKQHGDRDRLHPPQVAPLLLGIESERFPAHDRRFGHR